MGKNKSDLARVKSHIRPEHQQEAILDAVLNIQANIMTMAGILMNLESKSLEVPPSTILTLYKRNFYENVRLMKEMFSDFGEIETF